MINPDTDLPECIISNNYVREEENVQYQEEFL